MTTGTTEFNWVRYPEAWNWINTQLETFQRNNSHIATVGEKLFTKAGTRVVDFTDHLVVEDESGLDERLQRFGYKKQDTGMWVSEAGVLPAIRLREGSNAPVGVALKTDSVVQFLMVWNLQGMEGEIEGEPLSRFRRCMVSNQNNTALWVVERRRTNIWEPVNETHDYKTLYYKTLETWQQRRRVFKNRAEGIEWTTRLAQEQVNRAGTDLAAYLFFEAERRYWQSRNRAAAIHKYLLDKLGMGWANHDHHTFRSSRDIFSQLVNFFQIIGFDLRERFYAGEEAGWGAQVVEHKGIDIALFLDVDLDAEELNINYKTQNLTQKEVPGTVGLWCLLHGDSILEAGLHHLAVRSHFDQLTENLAKEKVKMMKPFSTLPYLLQAFTRGQHWKVPQDRAETLLEQNIIDNEQMDQYVSKGAVGSHLENIQRSEGYKGFSQKEVSSIIRDTDPRHYSFD